MKRKIITILAFLVLGMTTVGAAEVTTGEAAPDFTLIDSQGQQRSLSDFKGRHVVLEWVNYECPFVVKHYKSGNMQSLQKTYADQGVVWLSVNSSAPGKQGYYTAEEINQVMANSGAAPAAYLIDESGEVGRLYGAKNTPHMYVINPEGVLVYQGAIDNDPGFDQSGIPGAENYVVAALAASMADEPVALKSTRAYGCSVKY